MSGGKLRRAFNSRYFWVGLYAIYLSLILVSVSAFFAEDSIIDIRKDMDEKYDYYLTFPIDGKVTHYDVTRHDTGTPGKISLTYWTQDNKLEIKNVDNIKTLNIDVQSMFEDESIKVFNKTTTQMPKLHMDYWLEAGDGVFTVEFNIDKSKPMEGLTFTKFPEPKSVLVNNQEWWKTNLNYTKTGEKISITNIPTGKTTVIIYFKLSNKLPTAAFTSTPATHVGVNEEISFDGSTSTDPDGTISSWVWTFGDSTSDSGKNVSHTYTKPGNYTVRLTVRDDSVPFGEDWTEKTIKVAFGAEDDYDSDGLRDIWEWEYFHDFDETGSGDYDDDGSTNKEEHEAGTDPTDSGDHPGGKGGEEKGTDMTMIIAIILIVIILLVVLLVVFRSKKSRVTGKATEAEEVEVEAEEEGGEDSEAIAEMEAKIARAKKLGLPTGEMEKLLRQAKSGKPLEVKSMKSRSGKGRGGGRHGAGSHSGSRKIRGPPKGGSRRR